MTRSLNACLVFVCAHAIASPAVTNGPALLLGLTSPVDVIQADTYRDGGSCAAMLRDAKGLELKFCVDNRVNTKTRGRITIGTYHPEEGGGTNCDPGSPVAKALRSIFKEWLDQPLLAPVWKMSDSGEMSLSAYRDIALTREFKTWAEQVLEQKKWPYKYRPWEQIEWAVRTYELLK